MKSDIRDSVKDRPVRQRILVASKDQMQPAEGNRDGIYHHQRLKNALRMEDNLRAIRCATREEAVRGAQKTGEWGEVTPYDPLATTWLIGSRSRIR